MAPELEFGVGVGGENLIQPGKSMLVMWLGQREKIQKSGFVQTWAFNMGCGNDRE
jgi:hypothetical protein